MTLALATGYRDVWGDVFVRRVAITLDNSYPNGGTKATSGWAITAKDLGFGSSAVLKALMIYNNVIDGYLVEWDFINMRIHVYQCPGSAAPAVELANGVSVMNGKILHAIAIGTGQHT